MYFEKIKKDPKWSEVVILYSGLFDLTHERYDFVDNIISENSYLAARCITSSLNNEKEIENKIVQASRAKLPFFSNAKTFDQGINAFFALVELEQFDDILDLFSANRGRQIVSLNSIIYSILNYYSNNLIYPVTKILSTHPEFYIKTVIEYIGNKDRLNNNLFSKIWCLIKSTDRVKAKHIINYIRFRPKNFVIDLDKTLSQRLLIETNSIDDLKFLSDQLLLDYNKNDIIDSRASTKLSIQRGFILFFLIRKNKEYKKRKLDTLINQLFTANEPIKLCLSIIFIFYFNKLNSFLHLLKPSHTTALINLTKKELLDDFNGFSNACLRMLSVFNDTIYAENINSYLGKTIRCKVVSKWRYHYVLQSPAGILNSSLLPIEETEAPLDVTDEIKVTVIYVDQKNLRLITSIKQLGVPSNELQFKRDYLNIVRKDDIIDCKVSKFENGLRISPVGFGKRLRCKVINEDFDYVPSKRNYQAKVVQIVSPFYIKVEVKE